jgi:hypothetical protein
MNAVISAGRPQVDRFVLLVLLAIPILVVVHIALVWRPTGAHGVLFWSAAQAENVQLQGIWRSEQTLPVHFVVARSTERGS